MSLPSVTSGFFDAVYSTVGGVETPDRAYNSKDLGGLLEGFIGDGVFAQIGQAFACSPGEDPLDLNVGSGRAWFNGHWINNSTTGVLTFEQPDIAMKRRDAVVFDIDESEQVRACDIKIVEGEPHSDWTDPELINTATHHQYFIAVVDFPILRDFGSIGDSNCHITYRIGTDQSTPFVCNLLNYIDPSLYTEQLERDFDAFISGASDTFDTFLSNKEADYTGWKTGVSEAWSSWFAATEADWDAWYAEVQQKIDATTAAQLRHMVRDYYEVTLNPNSWVQLVTTEPYMYKYDLDVTAQGYTDDSVVEVDMNTASTAYQQAETFKQAWAYVYASDFSADNKHLYLYAYDWPNASIPIVIRGK